MAYTNEVVRRARKRLEEINGDLQSQQQARLAQAYIQFPRLKEIDLQLQRTMVAAAKAAFSSGNVADAMEAVRKENQALQCERGVLIASNFPEGYLSDEPSCVVCGGSGYMGTQMCRCLDALCRQEQAKEINRLGSPSQHFGNFDLSYYPEAVDPRAGVSPRLIMEKNLNVCRQYAQTFSVDGRNLLFNGGTGLGKTFLAMCIAREVAAKGYAVCYETAISLFSKLEKAQFNTTEETQAIADELYRCDLLIIDDLGTEMAGQFVTSALYGIVNDRLMNHRPMVVTTNLNIEEAGRRYSPQIASRLYGEFFRLHFLGSDIRVLKNQLRR